jgi:protein phosphatase 1 regulatory subunit 10
MDLYNASAWLHHPPQASTPLSSLHAQHEGRQSSTDDWKDRSSLAIDGPSPSVQPSLEMNDFTMDLPGEPFCLAPAHQSPRPISNAEADPSYAGPSSSATPLPSPPPPFFSHAYPSNYFLPSSVPGPYNAIAYGSWPSQSQLPLSNYSSLNGATTTSSAASSSSPQQQQQSSLAQQMMIEYDVSTEQAYPVLTLWKTAPP